MNSPTSKKWQYLARDSKSPRYRQLCVKGRRIAARILYGMYVSQDEPKMTADEIAEDYDLPLDAVLEAIAYCESNPPEIAQDFAREEAIMEASGENEPDYKYHPQPRFLPAQEMARLRRL